ncbi:hypothetical protein CR513_52281, partial [Mucuna pruriens]
MHIRKVFSHRNMRVSSISLGICGRENGVKKNKCAKNLCSKAITFGVSFIESVGTTTKPLILSLITYKVTYK